MREDLATRAVRVLRQIEWSGIIERKDKLVLVCPYCGGINPYEDDEPEVGHREHCALAEVIKEYNDAQRNA